MAADFLWKNHDSCLRHASYVAKMNKRVAVIGAGMSGLTCASRLREFGHEVVIFEKSRGVSGRISTRKLDNGYCDHGAQYITATSVEFKEDLRRWKAEGLIDLWSPRLRVIGDDSSGEPLSVDRYVGTPRMTSPLGALADQFDVRLSWKVQSLERRQGGWALKGEDGAVFEQIFDAVIFAIPAPQVLQLLGPITPSWLQLALSAEMLPCWAVMATLIENQAIPFDAAFVNTGPLAWIANNASKPGRAASPIWTLHATAAWTASHLNDESEEIVKFLVDAFQKITQLKVAEAIAHRWLYAKAQPKSNQAYLWDAGLRLAACGDWLCSANVEGAWRSGQACAEGIMQAAKV